jgi:hypothetical protein
MQGRDFLGLASEIMVGGTEVHWRGAAGRAYYALMLEGRDALLRWGFSLPPRENVHTFVRLRFVYAADRDAKAIGQTLEKVGQLRNRADYDLTAWSYFASEHRTRNALQDATDAVNLLISIDRDPARRTALVAAIRKVFP